MRIFLRILIACVLGYGVVLVLDYRSYIEDRRLMLSAHFQVFELLCPIVAPGSVLKTVNFSGVKEYVLTFPSLRTGRYELSVSFPKHDAKNGMPCCLMGSVLIVIIQNNHTCYRQVSRLKSSFCRDGLFIMDGAKVDIPGYLTKGVACEVKVVFDEDAMRELMKYSDVVISMKKGSAE